MDFQVQMVAALWQKNQFRDEPRLSGSPFGPPSADTLLTRVKSLGIPKKAFFISDYFASEQFGLRNEFSFLAQVYSFPFSFFFD